MKSHGDKMFERRHGRIAFRWDFRTWGIGVETGAFRDDWLFVDSESKYYWHVWVKFMLGPFSIEFSFYGPGRQRPLPEFKRFGELKIGTVFEVNENTSAIKTSVLAGMTDKGEYVYYSRYNMVQTWDYMWGE